MKLGTYKQIQEYIKEEYGVTVKTCWIADLKEEYDLKTREAYNRIDYNKRTNPCPERHREKIVSTFRFFGMIN